MNQENTNIAETLARVLPVAKLLDTPLASANVFHIAVPEGMTLKEIDGEKFSEVPRRTVAHASMGDSKSFIEYVARHAGTDSLVWCNFNPQSYALDFKAVIDEHGKDASNWRTHTATFKPGMSAEWLTWTGMNKKEMGQVAFAEFLEANEADIVSLEGFPTSLQMMAMATEFEAKQDMRIKSMVRLQSGGVQMEYVNDADAGTTEKMKLFEKFSIGIPVFWSPPGAETVTAFPVTARLRYRLRDGKVVFWYELIRADLVHQKAATTLIAEIRTDLGATPMLLGACN